MSSWVGHTDRVWSVSVLGDARIVSGSADATVRVWDVSTGSTDRAFSGHSGAVFGVCALGSDGARVVSASEDTTLRVWDVSTGECARVLAGHGAGVTCVCAIGGEGELIVSGSRDATLRVWDAGSSESVRELRGHTAAVFGVCALGPGTRVVSASRDSTLRVWVVSTGSCERSLTGHGAGVNGVCSLPESSGWGGGARVASASADRTVRVWDADAGTCLVVLAGHGAAVWSVAALRDGRIVSASGDATLRVWATSTGACDAVLSGHRGWVVFACALADTGDGERLVSASCDHTLRVWRIAPRPVAHTLKDYVALSPPRDMRRGILYLRAWGAAAARLEAAATAACDALALAAAGALAAPLALPLLMPPLPTPADAFAIVAPVCAALRDAADDLLAPLAAEALAASAPNADYASLFVPGGWAATAALRMPHLSALLAATIDGGAANAARALARLAADAPALAAADATLFPDAHRDAPPGRLVAVDPAGSDAHCGGQAVLMLTFSCGRRLVYKPFGGAAAAAFSAFVNNVLPAAALLPFALRVPAVLRGGDGDVKDDDLNAQYHWAEFISRSPCAAGGAAAFYGNAGALAAIAEALGASDIHCENLVGAGEVPVIIDSETLFQPRPVGWRTAPAADMNPLLQTLLLQRAPVPFSVFGGHWHAGFQHAAWAPRAVPCRISHDRQNGMSVRFSAVAPDESSSNVLPFELASARGEPAPHAELAPLSAHAGAFLSGYAAGLRAVSALARDVGGGGVGGASGVEMDAARAALSRWRPRAAVALVRRVLKHTSFYVSSLHALSCASALATEAAAAHILGGVLRANATAQAAAAVDAGAGGAALSAAPSVNAEGAGADSRPPLERAEVAALLRRDVPSFYLAPAQSAGVVLTQAAAGATPLCVAVEASDGFERWDADARAFPPPFRAWSDADIEARVSALMPLVAARVEHGPAVSSEAPAPAFALVSAALNAADRLLLDSFGGASVHTHDDLYRGPAGLLIFFSALVAELRARGMAAAPVLVLACEELLERALNPPALAPEAAAAADCSPPPWLGANSPAAAGAYAAAWAGARTARPEWVRRGAAHLAAAASVSAAAALSRDGIAVEVMSGLAGSVLVALAVRSALAALPHGDDAAEALAVAVADAGASSQLESFAFAAAGRLADWADAVSAAPPAAGPPPATPSKERRTHEMAGFAHGLAGVLAALSRASIALESGSDARLARSAAALADVLALRVGGTEGWRAEAWLARNGAVGPTSWCHGRLPVIAAFRMAARAVRRPGLAGDAGAPTPAALLLEPRDDAVSICCGDAGALDVALALGDASAAAAAAVPLLHRYANAQRDLFPAGAATSTSFFKGPAGLAYALLRLAADERGEPLPCVLLFEL